MPSRVIPSRHSSFGPTKSASVRSSSASPKKRQPLANENSHYEIESDHQMAQSKLIIRHPRKSAEKTGPQLRWRRAEKLWGLGGFVNPGVDFPAAGQAVLLKPCLGPCLPILQHPTAGVPGFAGWQPASEQIRRALELA
jgi:hypothetical protein